MCIWLFTKHTHGTQSPSPTLVHASIRCFKSSRLLWFNIFSPLRHLKVTPSSSPYLFYLSLLGFQIKFPVYEHQLVYSLQSCSCCNSYDKNTCEPLTWSTWTLVKSLSCSLIWKKCIMWWKLINTILVIKSMVKYRFVSLSLSIIGMM